jgi:predicted GNAT family acetyltransferase
MLKEDLQVTLNESTHRFEISTGEETAYIDYAWQKDVLVLLYVYVPIPFRGKGYSTVLIQYALQYAREKNVKISVYCSYINGYLRRHPEYHDLLVEQ